MKLSFRPRYFLGIMGFLLGMSMISYAQNNELFSTFQEAVAFTGQFNAEQGPSSVNWIDGGKRYSYISFNSESGRQEIRAYDPKKDDDVLIFDGEGITYPDSDQPFSYSSFQWTADSKYLLFQTNFRPIFRRSGKSDFYMFSIKDQTLQLVAKDAGTAEVSPDGSKVGFERGGNLFIYTFATGEETQLTNDATKHVFNGKFGWAYEEEFGLAQAWSWSPDSRYIAYWQEDEREVPEFQMTDYAGQWNEYVKIRYPKVGDTNPTVRIGVIDLADMSQKWLNVNENGEHYIPRINWTGRDHFLSVMILNRAQNHLKLHFFDVRSGEGNVVMEEQNEAWVDVFDFFAGIMHLLFFPEDTDEFFWISDRDGYAHLYRYSFEGELLNQVTKGEWEVTYVHGFDTKKKRVYYTSTEKSPLERHLYEIKYDGKKKKQLSLAPGRHSFDLSPDTKYFIDTYSNVMQPRMVELWSTKPKKLKTLADNSSSLQKAGMQYAPRELFTFTTSDGQPLDGYIIHPIGFDSTKTYPLVLDIYGGPGAQGVYNEFGTSAWQQFLAHQGYLVVNVNNRGSGGYGKSFEKMVYQQLGKWESFDFTETAKYWGRKSWVDSTKMAIRGHSYGGYMTTYTLLTHPDAFAAGVAGAPLTDWRNYDSFYAERYMGLIDETNEEYIQSASPTHAANLTGRLFIAHSSMDENVHVKNTFQLVEALTRNGKDADLRIYPPGAHGVAFDRNSYFLLYNTYVEFLNRHLK